MSHNIEPEKDARNHKPAIIAIIVALVVAALVFFVFTPGVDEQEDGIATSAPPADTPISDAGGLGEDVGEPTTPGADTPADGSMAPAGTADRPAGDDAPAPAN
ncbi:hypothetical protein [Paracoccus sp. Ld10]|uniref:hypothetical protein n=1 Tax=Paracoccus sp. Ld10 TaxID=649158 RepID=UPI0038665444